MLRALIPFLGHLAGQGRSLALLFMLGLVSAAASLASPLLGKAFVDIVALHGDFGLVPWIAAALIALAGCDVVLGAVSSRLHARVAASVLASVRAALFARCLDAPIDAIERFRHGDLLTRFGSDAPRIQGLLVDGVLGAVQAVLFLLVAAAITFTLSPSLAVWSFLGVLLALVVAHAFRTPVERRTRRVRDAMADLSHFLAERVGALRAIRMHGAGGAEQRRLGHVNDRLDAEVVGFQALDALARGAPALLVTFALAWVYVLGGRLLETGSITLGTFVAFVLYQGRLFGPAQGLIGLVRNLQEARVSVTRVAEILACAAPADHRIVAPDAPDGGVAGDSAHAASPGEAPTAKERRHEAVVRFDHVAFAYPGKPPLLIDIDLRLAPGERVALFGASGTGKSTIASLLFGLREPAAGTVHVEGVPPRNVPRELLAYACAEPFLLHASVEENVRYAAPQATRGEIEHALEITGAAAFVRALPQGLATVIGGRGLALSDGQRQRLGLARALLCRARILVLDEAFSGLDLETEGSIRSRLWDAVPPACAVLAISHRPCGLDEFDRIVFLHDGRLMDVTPERLASLVRYERAWT